MPSTRTPRTASSRLGWTVVGLIIAWSVAQGSLLQFSAGSAAVGPANALFLFGALLSLGAHELVQVAARAALRRRGRASTGASAELAVAGCGPLACLLLGIAVIALAKLAYASGVADPLIRSLAAIATFNIVLGGANMVLAAPMDGGRLLHAFLLAFGCGSLRAARVAGAVSEVIALSIIALGFVAALNGGLADAFAWILIGVILFVEGRTVRKDTAELSTEPAQIAQPKDASMNIVQGRRSIQAERRERPVA